MERWDLYDETGCLTGETMLRGEKVPAGRYHRVVEVLFLNSLGQVLLQKRSPEKMLVHDILWYPTGGAVVAGETPEAACLREVQEELGFSPDMACMKRLHHKTEHSFIRDVFLVYQDMPVEAMCFQPGEVELAKWLYPEEIMGGETEKAFVFMAHLKEIFPFLMLESMRVRIPEGKYRHYKGNEYRVTGLCLHSETLETMVIYQALYGTKEIWVRPAAMWQEMVPAGGGMVRRFEKSQD